MQYNENVLTNKLNNEVQAKIQAGEIHPSLTEGLLHGSGEAGVGGNKIFGGQLESASSPLTHRSPVQGAGESNWAGIGRQPEPTTRPKGRLKRLNLDMRFEESTMKPDKQDKLSKKPAKPTWQDLSFKDRATAMAEGMAEGLRKGPGSKDS